MMPSTNWHNAVAHVDADAFYAACEVARRPDLAGRPVCVLSNQNAFVVAKSYKAKGLGVTTGMAVNEAARLAPDAVFLPPDFRYYGQMSERMFTVLRRYSPEVEVYSIDEGFMDMNGLRTLWRKGFHAIADDIRTSVKREVGITVSVGVANTKTLAKIASDRGKPDGSTVVPGTSIPAFLADLPVRDIPGIGASREALLRKFGIQSALQFAEAGEGLVRRLLGRHGLLLRHELCGIPVLSVEVEPPLPKSVARTASMGKITSKMETLRAHLSRHTLRLVSELVAKGLLAERLRVFLTLDSFATVGVEIHLPCPTHSFRRISQGVESGLHLLYRGDRRYRGCGIIATHIRRKEGTTPDLFGLMREDARQERLMLAVNEANRTYGRETIAPAAMLPLKKKDGATPRFRYPVIEAG